MTNREYTNSNGQNAMPWYRFGMVWMIIVLPLTVVVASLITVSIAFDSAPIVVSKANHESVTDQATE